MSDTMDVNQLILDLRRRWKFNGDLMTCTCCGYSIIASRINEQPRHADGCKNSSVDQNPWAELRSALNVLLQPIQPEPSMKIEEIFTEFDRIHSRMMDKSRTAREVAKKAHKNGDTRKRDKFNAVARVYEMAWADLAPLNLELLRHTPAEFQNDMDIPF